MAFSTEMVVSTLYADRSNHRIRSLSRTHEGNMRKMTSNDASSSTQSSPTVFKHFPNEILRHIFFLSLPEKPTTSPSEAPLLLANVCCLWRNIVNAFPLLFDGLPFGKIPTSGNLCVEESLTGFGTVTLQENWVYGHGVQQLVSFSSVVRADYSDSATLIYPIIDERVQSCLRPYFSTLKALDLRTTWKTDIEQLYALPTGLFTALESLRLDLLPELPTAKLLYAFDEAPRLRKVVLGSGHRVVSLPWSQLTHLKILDGGATLLGIKEFTSLLLECKNLEEGAFALAGERALYPKAQSAQISRELKELTVYMYGDAELSVFDNIYLPALQSFHLRIPSPSRNTFLWNANGQFIGQLRKIERLTLSGVKILAGDLITFLLSAHALQILCLDLRFDSSLPGENGQLAHFIDWMSFPPTPSGSTMLAPNLKDLRLWIHDWTVSGSSYISMAQRRWKASLPSENDGSLRISLFMDNECRSRMLWYDDLKAFARQNDRLRVFAFPGTAVF